MLLALNTLESFQLLEEDEKKIPEWSKKETANISQNSYVVRI